MATTNQYGDIWGTVPFEDREENYRDVGDKRVMTVAVKSLNTGDVHYVSFWNDAFPEFKHPERNSLIYVRVKIQATNRGGKDYVNKTAMAVSVFPVTNAVDTRSGSDSGGTSKAF